MTSGGADPSISTATAFNPTNTPHWEYVSAALANQGCPSIRPGLPAMHTVDEALMLRARIEEMNSAAAGSVEEVVVVTSDFQGERARHLFGIAFGDAAGLPLPLSVELVPGVAWGGRSEAERLEHEKSGLHKLKTCPFGAWADFLDAHRLDPSGALRE